jgi:ribosomal protein S24E
MNFTTITSTHNPLLARIDTLYRVAFTGATPSRHAIVQSLNANERSAKEKGLVIVRHIYVRSGDHEATILVSTYTDPMVAENVERASLIKKQTPAETKAEA